MALGIDARDGLVATDGWLETSATPAVELARQFADEPMAAIIYTDIATDGMLAGPNLDGDADDAAGGRLAGHRLGRSDHGGRRRALAAIPVAGCIIGRALYEGKLTLADALAASRAILAGG